MENVFVTIACLAVLLLGLGTVVQGSFNSVDTMVYALKEGQSQSDNIRQTTISAVSSTTYDAGSKVDLYLKNDGQVSLNNFSKWDVIVRYEDGTVQWLPYGTSVPGWSVTSILIDGRPEVFNPDIFDPAETIKLLLKLQPSVTDNSTNVATVAASNGVSAEVVFGH